jgi:hypothetical protein
MGLFSPTYSLKLLSRGKIHKVLKTPHVACVVLSIRCAGHSTLAGPMDVALAPAHPRPLVGTGVCLGMREEECGKAAGSTLIVQGLVCHSTAGARSLVAPRSCSRRAQNMAFSCGWCRVHL